jgi:hypothetical protein
MRPFYTIPAIAKAVRELPQQKRITSGHQFLQESPIGFTALEVPMATQ